MADFGLPGSYDYDGDCGVSPTPTKTVAGSGGGSVGPEGAHEVPFAGGGEKNILDGPNHRSADYALDGVPD